MNSSSDWEMPGATMSDWSIDMPQVIAAGAMPPLTAVAVWLRRCRKCSRYSWQVSSELAMTAAA